MSQPPRDAVIQEYVKGWKMPAIGREYPVLSRQARDGGWAYEDDLKELLERERPARYEHTAARRLKQARCPAVKTLDHREWTARQGVSRPQGLELASCASLTKGEAVVVVGPVGTGQTPLGSGLGVEAPADATGSSAPVRRRSGAPSSTRGMRGPWGVSSSAW